MNPWSVQSKWDQARRLPRAVFSSNRGLGITVVKNAPGLASIDAAYMPTLLVTQRWTRMRRAIRPVFSSPWAAKLSACYVRASSHPRRWRLEVQGAQSLRGPGILCFWHSDLLLASGVSGHFQQVAGLVSRSRDGGLAAGMLAEFGHLAIRASRANKGKANKGGWDALGPMAQHLQSGGWLALTPDGPRGPAGSLSPAIVQLARFTGAPVRGLGLAAHGTCSLGTWDRLKVPLPWLRGAAVIAPPLALSRRADATQCRDFSAALLSSLHKAHLDAVTLLEAAT